MFHKAEEWKRLRQGPKIKLMKEYGRCLRLDDEAERNLLAAAATFKWRKRSWELFRDRRFCPTCDGIERREARHQIAVFLSLLSTASMNSNPDTVGSDIGNWGR
jgi:hypothetical protein